MLQFCCTSNHKVIHSFCGKDLFTITCEVMADWSRDSIFYARWCQVADSGNKAYLNAWQHFQYLCCPI